MAEDIVPSLLQTINQQFDAKAKNSTKLKYAVKALQSKKATYRDVNEYAIEVGNILADTLGTNIEASVLPDGKMYFNIADRLLNETLQKNFDLISGYADDVQSLLNEQAGLHLEVQHPEFNKEKVAGIVNRISSEDDFDDIKWITSDPIINFSQSVVDDYVDANIGFQSKIGLNPLITRRLMGRACKWCNNLAGTYNYGEEPHDIYRRHENCRCIVEYNPGTGKKQNVHSKRWKDTDKNDRIRLDKQLAQASAGKEFVNSKHSRICKRERQISDEDISKTLSEPLKTFPIKTDDHGLHSQKIIGEQTTVVINPDTKKIITTYPTKSRNRKKYMKEDDA